MQDLEYFYQLDVNGQPVISEYGENVYREKPETKTLADLKRVISKNKGASIIDSVVDMYIKHQQWEFFDKYQEYSAELEYANRFNSSLPVIGQSEDGSNIYAEPKALPEKPVRPELLIVDEFKTQNTELFRQYNKLNAFEFNGVLCSVCEADQHGWSDLMLANMTKDSMGWPYEPIPFSNENGNKVVLSTREEWDSFYVAAWAARQEFFK